MAVTQNTYTGNGSTTNYSFTFPYLETTDIKVSVNGTITTAYTLANATTIQFNTAPVNGAAIRIYRETDDAALAATFYPGSAIRSSDLNENFTQNLYVTQESSNSAATATSTANTALTNSNTAISTANTALSTSNTAIADSAAAVTTANTASSNASAAVSTANTASTNATTAVSTANTAASNAATALSTANTALSTANTASTNATAAVSTANTASTNASSAVTTANTASSNASSAVSTANTASSNASTALSTANTAISTANAAASAVANAILYDTVANVAAIPGSPANNDAVEVVNSTGIESFTPLSGIPAGFVGDSGLSVRMVYTTTGATWNWIQYFPNDPENRYGDAITTLQTDLNTAEADIVGLDSSKYDKTGGTISGSATVTGELNVRGTLYKTVAINGTDYAVLYVDSNSLSFARKNGTNNASEIRFLGADPVSDWTGLTGSPSVTGAHIWVLPTADGNAGQAMVTDGSEQLSWATFLAAADIGTTVQGYDANTAKTSVAQTFTAPQRGGVVSVGSSASITLNFSTGNNFATTLTTSATLTPANQTAGQHGIYVLTQDGTGGRTMAFDSVFKFPGGIAPSLTTTAGAVDVLVYYVESTTRITCRLVNDVK